MTDNVSFQLEQMLPELDDLSSKGLFSKPEIRAIVASRKSHEFALARRISKLKDFMDYISYEQKLESLRKKRKARILAALQATEPETGKKRTPKQTWKGSVSDHSLRQRIHFIYSRALSKFPGSVSTWFSYFDFCQRTGASKALSRAHARAILLHPAEPTFWIAAGDWEVEQGNVGAGRKLLMRGLRMCGEKEEVWLALAAVEVGYIEKIKARREILLGKRKEETPKEDEDGDIEMDDGDEESEIKLPGDETPPRESETERAVAEITESSQPFFDGAVPKIVYRNAIKAIPNSLSFRTKFLDIFRTLPQCTALVLDSIRLDFPGHPDAIEVLARYHLDVVPTSPEFPGKLREAVGVWQAELEASPSVGLYSKFLEFLAGLRDEVNEPNLEKYLDLLMQQTYNTADSLSLLDEAGYLAWATLDSDVLEKGLAKHPNSAALRVSRLTSALTGDPSTWLPKLRAELKGLDTAGHRVLWTAYLDTLMATEKVKAIEAGFTSATGKDGLKDDEDVVARYLDWMLEMKGIEGVRKVVDSLAKSRTRGLKFWEDVLGVEVITDFDEEEEEMVSPLNSAFDWRAARFHSLDLPRLRRYLDSATSLCTDPGPWLSYIKFEVLVGKDVKRADKVRERGQRVVEGLEEMVAGLMGTL